MEALRYSRGVRLTSSGYVVERPTVISAMTIFALTVDTVVKLRDGGPTGSIVWEAEGDNGASSPPFVFIPPLRFFIKPYAEISGDANSSASFAVVEP